ncbi:hypothetical protein [Brevundimonas vancanneytii]|uniref:Uncharacterized protein n=1 Tax=Brevundimonas vancanneytii TaxID=1325724 RepID=A0A4P1JRB2_9CAUL|nr:hypothetical protein [Brevundimonas vancanneytii]VTO10655.1 Uncharacterised protein [Brevundimonas vancanneytii]
MDEVVKWALQVVAALGALGVFWQLWVAHRAQRTARLALLQLACRGDGEVFVVEVIWRGPSVAEGLQIEARLLAPRDAVIAPNETLQQGAPSRQASDMLWRPIYTRQRVHRAQDVMTRFRVTSPHQLTRVRLQLTLKSTATKRSLIKVTRWLSPSA